MSSIDRRDRERVMLREIGQKYRDRLERENLRGVPRDR